MERQETPPTENGEGEGVRPVESCYSSNFPPPLLKEDVDVSHTNYGSTMSRIPPASIDDLMKQIEKQLKVPALD